MVISMLQMQHVSLRFYQCLRKPVIENMKLSILRKLPENFQVVEQK